MRRVLLASAGFMAVLATLATVFIVRDRAAVMEAVEERTRSMARLIMAHGEGFIEDANKVIAGLDEPVRAWDLKDPQEGQRLFSLMRELLLGSPQISSAWVMDGEGISRLDSWTFPPKPIDGSERPYFKAHLAGAPEPVILGDPRPGVITGKQRFTFSRSQRNPNGSLHAVLVVGIYNEYFDRLYAEVATWPGARAGLHNFGGGVLGQLQAQPSVTPQYIAAIEAGARARSSGSEIIPVHDGARLASWQRSAKYPDLYATSSQPIGLALAEWRQRSWVVGLSTALAGLGLSGLVLFAARAAAAREAARQQEMLSREVHHRVKNSLQMAVSFLNLHAKKAPPQLQDTLAEAALQVSAIADVHELIQESTTMDRVDVCALLRQLCTHFGSAPEVAFRAGEPLLIGATQATNVAIITNELVTNALKHARSRVEVSCAHAQGELLLEVQDDGPGLPAGFDLAHNARFGLRMVASIAAQLEGRVTAQSTDKGAVFRVRLPRAALMPEELSPDQAHNRIPWKTRAQPLG